MKKLHYNIEIRDKDGKPYRNDSGVRVYEAFFFEEPESDANLVHLTCVSTYHNYKAVCKEGSEINIEVSYFDNISKTWSVLYSFYGETIKDGNRTENKFIKH